MRQYDKTDPTGRRYGFWTVLGFGEKYQGRLMTWLCRCECGTTRSIRPQALRGGTSHCCGCTTQFRVHPKHGGARQKSGRFPEYNVWLNMRERCFRPTNSAYRNYGARGITVCERWKDSFENFLADMGPRPSPEHSLDRIDNEGDYTNENCRWTTRDIQNRNSRHNSMLEAFGKRMCAKDWARSIGVHEATIHNRLKAGWPLEDVLGTPSCGKRPSQTR